MPLSVLYEDQWLIAVNKPPGIVVHPTYRNWTGTLLNGLLWHMRARSGVLPGPKGPGPRSEGPGLRDAEGPRIVTRLDKGTSGIVLVALTAQVHARIQNDAAKGRVLKQYLGIVAGSPDPPRGSIALPLARSVVDRRRVVVDPSGRESRTGYEVLSSSNGRSVVRCELVTGRTHQIRVHMAARGWPIVGDPVYSAPDEVVPRLALHAWRVTMPHPETRELLEIEAPLPDDLQRLIDQNRTL
jgi:23S rRNA pseudouridine1911/1915/1917 synthase